MTRPKMSSCLSKRSSQIVTLLFFCSSVSSFGTIFAHTFLMSISSVKSFLTVSLPMFTCSAMLLTVSRQFSRTIWRFFAMFSSVLLAAGRPDLSSSVTLSLPSDKRFTHCKLLFSSYHYPRKHALTSLWFRFHSFKFNKKFNVRSLL